MVSKTIIFNHRYGIDIYFATEVMRKAREFESKIEIEYDGKKIKNKSSLMLSGFGIKMGSEITIYADGADEEEALETVSNLLGIIAEEDICKQEMAIVDEREELEKEKNRSPEEIEKELEKIVEEAASNKDNLTIGKRIICSRRNNQLGIGINSGGCIIHPFDLMAGPDFDVKTSIERIWDVIMIESMALKLSEAGIEKSPLADIAKSIENKNMNERGNGGEGESRDNHGRHLETAVGEFDGWRA